MSNLTRKIDSSWYLLLFSIQGLLESSCLIASAKFRNAKEASHRPTLIDQQLPESVVTCFRQLRQVTLHLCALFLEITCPCSGKFLLVYFLLQNFRTKFFRVFSFTWICWIQIYNFTFRYTMHYFLCFSLPTGVWCAG